MGLIKTIGIIILILIVIIIGLGVKLYFDIMDDKKDLEKFLNVNENTDVEELNQICEEKEYFKPACQAVSISTQLEKGEQIDISECDKIEFNSVPYYLFFFEDKIVSYVEEIRTGCKKGFSEADIIIELGEDLLDQLEFCGTSTYDECDTNEDCTEGGCSGQLCQSVNAEKTFTTCEYLECYNNELYGLTCQCIENQCQWN